MKIHLYTISKHALDSPLQAHYEKQCKAFGRELICRHIFSNAIAYAQTQGTQAAQASYTKALVPLLLTSPNSINIALHPSGTTIDSKGFARLLDSRAAFFIGGAYGFGEAFLARTHPISLSALTLSHKIACIVVLEQIYRALSLNANHPYHK